MKIKRCPKCGRELIMVFDKSLCEKCNELWLYGIFSTYKSRKLLTITERKYCILAFAISGLIGIGAFLTFAIASYCLITGHLWGLIFYFLPCFTPFLFGINKIPTIEAEKFENLMEYISMPTMFDH